MLLFTKDALTRTIGEKIIKARESFGFVLQIKTLVNPALDKHYVSGKAPHAHMQTLQIKTRTHTHTQKDTHRDCHVQHLTEMSCC